MKRGDVWTVIYPELQVPHPGIILSTDLQFGREDTVIVVPTTDADHAEAQFRYVFRAEWSQANGLTKPSTVLCFRVRPIAKKRLVSKRGVIESEYLEKIEQTIIKMLGLKPGLKLD